MSNELELFKKLPRKNKIEYMMWFYTWMIAKTKNQDYIKKFKSTKDEVKWYEENKKNADKLNTLYTRILWAKQKTKQKRIKETEKAIEKHKEELARIQSNEDEEDPDEYLAKQLANI